MTLFSVPIDFDLWVEIVGIIIALVIAGFSYYAYTLTKQRKQLYFSAAFFMIAMGWVFSAIFNSMVEFEETKVFFRGYLLVPYQVGLMLIASMLFIIAGYMTIFIINEQIKSRKTIFLLYLMVIFSVLVAHDFYFLFHLTVFFILSMIVNYYAWQYRQQRTANSLLVLITFSLLLLSHVVMIFIPITAELYVVGSFLQLISFVVLLVALIRIYEKKT